MKATEDSMNGKCQPYKRYPEFKNLTRLNVIVKLHEMAVIIFPCVLQIGMICGLNEINGYGSRYYFA